MEVNFLQIKKLSHRASNESIIFQGECDPSFGAEFVFTIHSNELIIGDIFVRIYNEQHTFPLHVSTQVTVINPLTAKLFN